MHRMNTTRVDALAEARQALRGMELAIRKARFNRAGTPAENTPHQKARRLPALRARDLRSAE
jgi:hypothetical protein